jgi:hypothetical protein
VVKYDTSFDVMLRLAARANVDVASNITTTSKIDFFAQVIAGRERGMTDVAIARTYGYCPIDPAPHRTCSTDVNVLSGS